MAGVGSAELPLHVALLVLITTNEPVGRLHPAVVRPGRCLAEVEFRALSAGEASGWLGTGERTAPATIAELYERRDGGHRVGRQPESLADGLYL